VTSGLIKEAEALGHILIMVALVFCLVRGRQLYGGRNILPLVELVRWAVVGARVGTAII
jgi:hypothetical protein